MRMRIYHNLDNNQLEAYVLADENRALSGQKKSIREALPGCILKLYKLLFDTAAATVATIHADGYGSIVVSWPDRMSGDVQLHAGSRECLCNRKLARNKDVEARTYDVDSLASALAAVLRSEAACRRANDLDTAPRFEYPAECRDCKRVASWQSTRWTRPTPLAETPADDADGDDADTTDDVAQAETVVVEPVEVEHDGVIDVEMVETAEIPAVEADTSVTVERDHADTASPAETTAGETTPRAVQSSPALPAECEAVTTVIPEVPPTPNKDAHVLAVSEHVIPTGQSVTDAFGVAYRAVHYVRRVVERRDGTTTKKKVAAVFRLGDTVHVVRRDRYESAGRDAAVEAEIAAHVARLQRAA